MQIRRLILETKDLSQLTSFYRDVLELPAVQEADQLRIPLEEGSLQFKPASTTAAPFYHFAFNIPCNKIEEAKTWMERRVELLWIEEYKSVIADFVDWNARSLYFFDPAGNIVELIARYDLNNAVEAPFSSQHFLSISEIGLVFPEPEIEAETTTLLRQYGLDYFSRQPPSPKFKAVGDEEGLWIIVSRQRPWYPTDKASDIFPVEMEWIVNKKNDKARFGLE